MMRKGLVLLFSVLSLALAGANKVVVRGVHPGREKYYNPEVDFTCFDGSDTIPYQLINDDYCDCKYVHIVSHCT